MGHPDCEAYQPVLASDSEITEAVTNWLPTRLYMAQTPTRGDCAHTQLLQIYSKLMESHSYRTNNTKVVKDGHKHFSNNLWRE